MNIDIGGSAVVTVAEPLLNLLHGNACAHLHVGAAMSEIMKADPPESVLFQENLKVI